MYCRGLVAEGLRPGKVCMPAVSQEPIQTFSQSLPIVDFAIDGLQTSSFSSLLPSFSPSSFVFQEI